MKLPSVTEMVSRSNSTVLGLTSTSKKRRKKSHGRQVTGMWARTKDQRNTMKTVMMMTAACSCWQAVRGSGNIDRSRRLEEILGQEPAQRECSCSLKASQGSKLRAWPELSNLTLQLVGLLSKMKQISTGGNGVRLKCSIGKCCSTTWPD